MPFFPHEAAMGFARGVALDVKDDKVRIDLVADRDVLLLALVPEEFEGGG